MAGTGTTDRGKEALGMMALHETLRNLCINTDWTYSVFWTIRPRPYMLFFKFKLILISTYACVGLIRFSYLFFRRLRGGNGCKVGDDNGSL